LADDTGAGVHLKFDGYLSHRASESGHVLVLSSVVGRPNKRERAEEPEDRLDTDTGKPFVGAFSVDLAAPSQSITQQR
jgi:beta-galactosidase